MHGNQSRVCEKDGKSATLRRKTRNNAQGKEIDMYRSERENEIIAILEQRKYSTVECLISVPPACGATCLHWKSAVWSADRTGVQRCATPIKLPFRFCQECRRISARKNESPPSPPGLSRRETLSSWTLPPRSCTFCRKLPVSGDSLSSRTALRRFTFCQRTRSGWSAPEEQSAMRTASHLQEIRSWKRSTRCAPTLPFSPLEG